MTPSNPLILLFFVSFLFAVSTVTAHNITTILEAFPEFSAFNDHLTQTHLAGEINRRSSVTVLAVKDISSLSGKTSNVVKNILATHIILDYYDGYKLQREQKKIITLTNLFQSSGIANGMQGFLNVEKENGEIRVGSAIAGAPMDAKLLRLVVSHPYTISVLELSSIIVTPGIDGNFTVPTAAAAPPPKPKESAVPEEAAESPVEDVVAAEAPTEEEASSPSEGPAPSEGPSPSEAPPPDEETPEMDAPPTSSGSRVVGSGVVGMALVCGLVGL